MSMCTTLLLQGANYQIHLCEHVPLDQILSLLVVICIVGACGFWLWVSELIKTPLPYEGQDSALCTTAQINVQFHAGFYVCIGSGIFCLIALSGNMICARTAVERRRQARQRLRLRERNFAQLLSRNSVEMTQMREQPRNQSTVESGLRVLNQSSSQINVPLSGPVDSIDTVPPPLTAHSSSSGLVPPPDGEFPPPDEEFPPPDEEFPPPADVENPSTDGPAQPTDEENPPPYVP